jgi:hypothetical protein
VTVEESFKDLNGVIRSPSCVFEDEGAAVPRAYQSLADVLDEDDDESD